MVLKSIKFAQNNIRSKRLASFLVEKARFTQNDIVYEIGTGSGVLTLELAKYCRKVISFEIDKKIYSQTEKKISHNNNIKLFNMDFLNYQIKQKYYKVFSNIPFNYTARIMRKLFLNGNPPAVSYLIMQKEALYKYTGKPGLTRLSLLLLPKFNIKITWEFKKTDFHPKPRVNVIMTRIHKRKEPHIDNKDWRFYKKLISLCFIPGKSSLKKNLKTILSYNQIKKVSKQTGFFINSMPSALTYAQWIKMFYVIKDMIRITG